jgi:hypothetical protein
MKPSGQAESALEQLLWSYALGRAYDPATRAYTAARLNSAEITAMFRHTCGVTPSREELSKWLAQLDTFMKRVAA